MSTSFTPLKQRTHIHYSEFDAWLRQYHQCPERQSMGMGSAFCSDFQVDNKELEGIEEPRAMKRYVAKNYLMR